MSTNNLVQTWLTDAGLHYAVDNFMMAGIDSPRSLVQLELGHFEMLGVKSSEDRKKLFFLMQRVKKALEEETMPSTAAAKVATTTNAATMQERDDKEEGKQKERRSDEFGISEGTHLSSNIIVTSRSG